MRTPIHNVEAKREFAAQMRRKPTAAEATLWYRLKKKQTGFVFHRQSLQRGYILDFYCPRLKLAIEVDGSIHNLKADEDARKEQALNDWGIKLLRFTNQEVLDFCAVVMVRIETTLKALDSWSAVDGGTTPSSSSSRQYGKVENNESAHPDTWKGLKAILNLPENLCRPNEIPDDQRMTLESAEAIVRACNSLITCDKQRAFAFREDNRSAAEKAFDQRYRLQEWLKKHPRPAPATDEAALTLNGMHVTEPQTRKA